jgi:acylphosphatase
MIARRYVVNGRVQGVGFRWYVMRRAQALKLRGSVRNLVDGRVEVVAAGPDDAMAQFERDLKTGPSLARVTDLDVTERPVEEITNTSFDVW